MTLRPFTLPLGSAGLGLLALAACAGASSTTSQATAALDSAQCTFLANHAAAEACRQAFQACLAQPAADVPTCAHTLAACLPPPPDGGVDHDRRHRGPPLFLPPPPDGGFGPPPFGPRPPGHELHLDCVPDGGLPPAGHGSPDLDGPPPVRPEPVAVTACHDALAACLTATPADPVCFETEHACEKAAFAAAFSAACQVAQPCTPTGDPACAELQERCHEGVDGRPGAFDGGTCP
jgi:hypothetical protein